MRWRVDLACLGALAAAVAVFFWRAFTMSGAFFVQDVMVQNYAFRDFFARSWRRGELLLWDPSINFGFPLFAEGQAGPLYPFNIASAFLPTYAAINVNIIFHYWLAGAAMYGLLRVLRAQPLAALTAGLAYALGGYMAVRAMSMNFIDVCAWLPLLFMLVALAARGRQTLYLSLAALVLGLQLLAGHPQAAAYGLMAVLAYGVYLGLCARRCWSYYVALALFVLGGIGIAAVQLLPTAELTQLSTRGRGLSWEQFVNMSLPPERFLELLLPNLHGNSAHGTYWGRSAGFFIQLCPFVGVLSLVLAWVALRHRRHSQVGFFALLASAGLVLSLGQYSGLFDLFYQIPGLSYFRIPTRFLLWFALAVSVLCGLGLDHVLRAKEGEPLRGRFFVFLLAAVACGALFLNREVFFAGGESLRGESLLLYARFLRIDALRLLLVLSVGLWILSLRGRRYAGLVAPLVIFVECYTFAADFNGVIEAEVYTQHPPTANAILQRQTSPVPPRILSLVNERNSPFDWHGGWAEDLSSYRRYNETLRMYSGGLYGLGNALPGWSPLHLRRHGEFARAYPGVASLAGVEYVISYGGRSLGTAEWIYGSDIQVFRLRDSLPRAYIAASYRVVYSGTERLRLLQNGGAGRQQVLLEKEPPERYEATESRGAVEITRYSPEEVVVELDAHAGGYLVLSDTYYPGWRAWVDGEEKEILRANHVFRAVPISAGAREVRFRFESTSFERGVWVSGLALVLCLCAFAYGWRQDRERVVEGAENTGALLAVALQGTLVFVLYGLVVRWPLWAGALERCRVLSGWGE